MKAGFTLEQCFHIGNGVAMLVIGAALAEVGPGALATLTGDNGSSFRHDDARSCLIGA